MSRHYKLALAFLAFLLLLITIGCNSNDKEDNQAQTEPTTNNEEKKEVEVEEQPMRFNASGFPITNDPITIKMLGSQHSVHSDFNDMLVFNKYEEMTNVQIEWELIHQNNIQEKRNLLLASGDYPDVFFRTMLLPSDISTYAPLGVFVPLDDLIDQYAPNIKKMLEDYPDIRKGITESDGKIYSLPYATNSAALIADKPWINQKWLDQLKLEKPTTVDEFYDVLQSFRDDDPNGNGLQDEIPLTVSSAGTTNPGHDQLLKGLQGAWGFGTMGIRMTELNIDLGADGELRFMPLDPKFKDLIEYVAKLYDEELIDPNIYTISNAQFIAMGDNEQIGSWLGVGNNRAVGSKYEDFTALVPFKGPEGDQVWGNVFPYLLGYGAFAMTNNNEYPEETIRWIDYFYGREGAEFYMYGIENETYVKEGDIPWYTDEVYNNPDGLSFGQAVGKFAPWGGGGSPFFYDEDFAPGHLTDSAVEGGEAVSPFIPKNIISLPLSQEESDELIKYNDVNIYIDEMLTKFITGAESLNNWDDFVNKLVELGVNDMLEIYSKAYDRYQQ